MVGRGLGLGDEQAIDCVTFRLDVLGVFMPFLWMASNEAGKERAQEQSAVNGGKESRVKWCDRSVLVNILLGPRSHSTKAFKVVNNFLEQAQRRRESTEPGSCAPSRMDVT